MPDIKLSDEEVICEFMEKRSTIECRVGGGKSWGGWWWRETEWSDHLKWTAWRPIYLDLETLHEVQNRLDNGQWPAYIAHLSDTSDIFTFSAVVALVRISASRKIKALAQVLRPLVEVDK